MAVDEVGEVLLEPDIERSIVGKTRLDTPLVAVVVAWECEEYIERCLGSIIHASQETRVPVGISVIVDASRDCSLEIATAALSDYPYAAVIGNRTRSGSGLANTDYAVTHIVSSDETICCAIDGDDWVEPHAFRAVWHAYLRQDLDFAWTQFRMSDGRAGFCRPIPRGENFRRYTWCSSHMKTWRRGTWRRIDRDRCFLDAEGHCFDMACDHAMMFALAEVGPRHQYIDECVYVYNVENERSVFQDAKTNAREQEVADYLRSL